MCQHLHRCPDAQAPDRMAARVVADHLEQGWSLLCNGVVLFEDGGALLADGRGRPSPHRHGARGWRGPQGRHDEDDVRWLTPIFTKRIGP
jgi:hypothetical protein